MLRQDKPKKYKEVFSMCVKGDKELKEFLEMNKGIETKYVIILWEEWVTL